MSSNGSGAGQGAPRESAVSAALGVVLMEEAAAAGCLSRCRWAAEVGGDGAGRYTLDLPDGAVPVRMAENDDAEPHSTVCLGDATEARMQVVSISSPRGGVRRKVAVSASSQDGP